MEEIWKPIKDYENKYEISNFGRVYSLKSKKTLKTQSYKNNYKYVCLGNKKKYKIHRLVAQAFIPNPNNYPIINHKDNNPSNNYVENLEWCTYKYNVEYCIKSGRFENAKKLISNACKEKKAYIKNLKIASEKNKKPIIQYDFKGNFIKEWECASDVEKELNIFATSIIKNCKKKAKHCGGFIWCYKGDNLINTNLLRKSNSTGYENVVRCNKKKKFSCKYKTKHIAYSKSKNECAKLFNNYIIKNNINCNLIEIKEELEEIFSE